MKATNSIVLRFLGLSTEIETITRIEYQLVKIIESNQRSIGT